MGPKKRYQVFVSSTFEDLKEERHEVMQAILDLHQFPAGMELFPSGNSKVFEYIKKIIDQSDYYVVIIGNKYGSLTDEGMSFTEAEHDYAEKQKVPIIALVHARPDTLPVEKSDIDPVLRKRLARFRDKVGARMVNKWETIHELGKAARTALHHAFQEEPRTGWVRADEVATVATPQADGGAELRAGLEAQVRLSGTYSVFNNAQLEWTIDISILDLYYEIFPSIERIAEEEFLGSVVPKRLARRVLSHEEFKEAKLFVFYPGQLDRIRNRLELLNLIAVEMRERDMAWVPTSLGRQIYLRVDAAVNPLTPPVGGEVPQQPQTPAGALAELEKPISVTGTFTAGYGQHTNWSVDTTYRALFEHFAADIERDGHESTLDPLIAIELGRFALKEKEPPDDLRSGTFRLEPITLARIRDLLRRLNIIMLTEGEYGRKWQLTDRGTELFVEVEARKATQA